MPSSVNASALLFAKPRPRRRHGTGSIWFNRAKNRWYAQISTPNGRRSWGSKTLAGAKMGLVVLQKKYLGPKGPPARASLRPLARQYVVRVMEIGRVLGWADDYLARVIIASVAAKRLRFGVFGPCVYCGDWTANTVDHVVPLARGGMDSPDNVVSACYPCNHDKRARTPDEWRSA